MNDQRKESEDQFASAALICAAATGQRAAVNRLLETGANPRHRDLAGRSALIAAAENGNQEIVELLLPLSSRDDRRRLAALAMSRRQNFSFGDYCREAMKQWPGSPLFYLLVGWAYRQAGQLDDAISLYRQEIGRRPDARIHSDLLFTLHFHPAYDRRRLFEEHQRWNEIHARPLSPLIQRHNNEPSPEKRLRIGYVAHGLGDSALGRFFSPLLLHHNRRAFEIFCYCDVGGPGAVGSGTPSQADVWRITFGMSDQQVAELVRSDGIDVLVDLAMHTFENRLLLFARKPAPVQVTYLAYCSTTGLKAIDYRFSDPYLDPREWDDSLYAERSVRLPRYWCYPQPVEAPAVGPLPAEMNGYVTFGCLNEFSKVTPDLVSAWAALLHEVPDAKLIVHCQPGDHRQRVLGRFALEDVAADRVRFISRLPLDQYFAQYNQIDIGLDPFAWSGGITTCDALWMGVPVVTLAGHRSVARGGLSILSTVGLSELIAYDFREYLGVAAALAADRQRLSTLRSSLREKMRDSPLMDGVGFTRAIEAAYRQMWRRWCDVQGQRPRLRTAEVAQTTNFLYNKSVSESQRRILVLCPDWNYPSGGVRKLYRHVDVLNAHGFNAFIEHPSSDFRCTWFENDTRVDMAREYWPPKTSDVLLCPEQVCWQMVFKTPGVPKVIFNQNAYQTFMGKSDEFKVLPYTHPDFLATIVVSEDSRRYVEYAFPGHPVFRVHNSINPELFHYGPDKKPRLAFMPRKNKSDATQLLLLLKCRNAIEGFEILPVQNMSEAETAQALRETAIFLSFSTQEGSPMPPLEALACGCVVIGYDGLGGREYVNERYAVPVPQEDVVSFCQSVERVIGELRTSPQPLMEKTRRASEFVLSNYSPAREEQDILAAWQKIVTMPRLSAC